MPPQTRVGNAPLGLSLSEITQSDLGLPGPVSVIPPKPNTIVPIFNSNFGTPMKSSSNHEQPPINVAKIKPRIASELSDSIFPTSTTHTTIYPSYSDLRINEFLRNCDLYNNKKEEWTPIKKVAKNKNLTAKIRMDEDYTPNRAGRSVKSPGFKENLLYGPLMEIIEAMLKFFDQGAQPPQRWVVDTHSTPMQHVEDGVTYLKTQPNGDQRPVNVKTSPDISILGMGPYFPSNHGDRPGYDHCLSPVEIKLDSRLSFEDVTIQVGVYARQCFIQQPHRRYVPTVVLTESILYLFVYDRSGLLHSEKVNIHKNAASFVRIILGISSVDENLENSPFDTRVVWTAGETFPTIKVKLPDQDPSKVNSPDVRFEVYQVTKLLFLRRTIRGRGAVCWEACIVRDGHLVKVLLKDSWRSASRPGEWELLEKIKGLKGVGQILSYEEDVHCTISALRNFIFKDIYAKEPYKFDRIFSRLVLKAYGPSIKRFRTKIQLLEAFRDTVAGHKNLWVNGILHRDISVENVLLGLEDAEEGDRGLLIDFDMATLVNRSTSLSDQFRTGTRAFQSCSVLKSADWGTHAPPQDHLDDLESFFYVLAWICHKYDGTERSLWPDFPNKWEDEDADICAACKYNFQIIPTRRIPAYFDTDIFFDLLSGLGKLCHGYYEDKTNLVSRKKAFPGLADIHKEDKTGKEHDKFLSIIDTAIEAQRKETEPERSATGSAEPPVTPIRSDFVDPPESPQRNIITPAPKGKKRQTAPVGDKPEEKRSPNKRFKQV